MKRILSLLLAAALLCCLAGCKPRKSQSFTAVLPGNVATLDPQTATGTAASLVIGSMYEGLCRVGSDSRPLPGVAESWSHNKDYSRFTFHLRRARWDNDEPVTAADFVFGVTRALRPETGASGLDDLFLIKNARAFYNGETETLGIRAEGERTLVIELENGYPDFPLLTAGNHYMPCNQAYFEGSAGHYGLSAEYTLSNGPFCFPHIYAWNTDYNERSIYLVQSDTYRGEHKTDAASITYLIDYSDNIDEKPVEALAAGDVDILELSEPLAKAAEEKGCGILALDDGVLGLLLNPKDDALTYVGTREVFIQALDRQDLLERGKRERNKEAFGIMPECVQWSEKRYYGQDEICYAVGDDDVSERLPSLLGLLQREKMASITVLCPNDEVSIQLANGILISWNNKLGTAFNIMPLPEEELKYRVAEGDYEAALYTLRAGGATPFDVLNAFSSNAYPRLMDDPSYDEELKNLSFTRDGFRAMEDGLQEAYVFYPLFTAQTYYAMAPGVSGVSVSPNQRISFSSARKR